MKSMTGFGAGRAHGAAGVVSVEIRSVNSRFLDLALRISPELSAQEPLIRGILQKGLSRGKVQVNVNYQASEEAPAAWRINRALLRELESLCAERGEAPPLQQLLLVSGVVERDFSSADDESIAPLVEAAVRDAVVALQQDREREGDSLRATLDDLRRKTLDPLSRIDAQRNNVVAEYQKKLNDRINELLGATGQNPVDPQRLAQEVAFYADRCDISEEITRLRAHLDKLEKMLAKRQDNPAGKSLEFLQQEMLRETNTIGSKAKDLALIDDVLVLKSTLESFREQIANVE